MAGHCPKQFYFRLKIWHSYSRFFLLFLLSAVIMFRLTGNAYLTQNNSLYSAVNEQVFGKLAQCLVLACDV